MSILLVTGTGTGVGKTVVTAALASVAMQAHKRVAVVKPAQTGLTPDEPGDCAEVTRLTGLSSVHELVRYREPLAPEGCGSGGGGHLCPWKASSTRCNPSRLRTTWSWLGAGGLLVRLDDRGRTLADLCPHAGGAPVVVVVAAALGTLNHTALTLEALDRRGLPGQRDHRVVAGPAGPGRTPQCDRPRGGTAGATRRSRPGRLGLGPPKRRSVRSQQSPWLRSSAARSRLPGSGSLRHRSIPAKVRNEDDPGKRTGRRLDCRGCTREGPANRFGGRYRPDQRPTSSPSSNCRGTDR